MTLEELVEKISGTNPSWFDTLPDDVKEAIDKEGMIQAQEYAHRGTKHKLETIMFEHGIGIEDLCNTPINVILTLFDLNAKIDGLCTTLDEIESWYSEMPATDY